MKNELDHISPEGAKEYSLKPAAMPAISSAEGGYLNFAF